MAFGSLAFFTHLLALLPNVTGAAPDINRGQSVGLNLWHFPGYTSRDLVQAVWEADLNMTTAVWSTEYMGSGFWMPAKLLRWHFASAHTMVIKIQCTDDQNLRSNILMA